MKQYGLCLEQYILLQIEILSNSKGLMLEPCGACTDEKGGSCCEEDTEYTAYVFEEYKLIDVQNYYVFYCGFYIGDTYVVNEP